MDPSTISTGVAGLHSLTLETVKLLTEYTSVFKYPPSQATDLLTGYNALRFTLEQVITFLKTEDFKQTEDYEHVLSAFNNSAQIYCSNIARQRSTFAKFARSDFKHRVRLPFNKQEIADFLQILQRCTQTLQFSLTMNMYRKAGTGLQAPATGRTSDNSASGAHGTQPVQTELPFPDATPPFPMPYSENIPTFSHGHQATCNIASTPSTAHSQFRRTFHSGDTLTPEEADIPCAQLDQDDLFRSLTSLTGLSQDSAERLLDWIRGDIQYFISRKFDFGIAYAAARVGWKHFNGPEFDVAAQRARWLRKAKEIDEERNKAIYKDSTGQELIHSPYSVMPRRIWDIKSNRVVEFRMLHAEVLSMAVDLQQSYPPFWAVTHSWTSDMRPVETSVNQHLWPVPLPKRVDLERNLRKELLALGADYVWLDVLCLRQSAAAPQRSPDGIKIKQDEWKLDVPTIGNIYRTGTHVVRYFNGLGKPFSKDGWDDDRHWLRRAWTLQEIRKEKTTFNGGVPYHDGNIILDTKGNIAGKVVTLRTAIGPILRLAEDADSPSGCKVYELAKEMARRYASNPTDKVAGMFYLLRTTELPTYDEEISEETAWKQCFHVLPYRQKIEILFDFPYRGATEQWFPIWEQLMTWPDRDPSYEHTTAEWPQSRKILELIHLGRDVTSTPSLFVPGIWAITHVLLRNLSNRAYEVKRGDTLLGFYSPYLSHEAIETDYRQFTLATLEVEQTSNWLVCEELSSQFGKYRCENGRSNNIKLRVLKKVGVLRTDDISTLVTGPQNSVPVIKKIDAFFM